MTTSVQTLRIKLKNDQIIEQKIFVDIVAVEIPINAWKVIVKGQEGL